LDIAWGQSDALVMVKLRKPRECKERRHRVGVRPETRGVHAFECVEGPREEKLISTGQQEGDTLAERADGPTRHGNPASCNAIPTSNVRTYGERI
jgi:hypothetical protein